MAYKFALATVTALTLSFAYILQTGAAYSYSTTIGEALSLIRTPDGMQLVLSKTAIQGKMPRKISLADFSTAYPSQYIMRVDTKIEVPNFSYLSGNDITLICNNSVYTNKISRFSITTNGSAYPNFRFLAFSTNELSSSKHHNCFLEIGAAFKSLIDKLLPKNLTVYRKNILDPTLY